VSFLYSFSTSAADSTAAAVGALFVGATGLLVAADRARDGGDSIATLEIVFPPRCRHPTQPIKTAKALMSKIGHLFTGGN
jgi:hypothetical protein